MVKLGPLLQGLFHRFSPWVVLGLGGGLGFFGAIGFNGVLDYTSSNAFCANCHQHNATMEWQESAHAQNPQGIAVDCASCHIPHEFWPKMAVKVMALGDVWSFLQGSIDSPEKYEAKRLQMARTVWADMAARDSRECKQCHRIEVIRNPDKPFVEQAHLKSLKEGSPCVKCHKGVAHLAPMEPETEDVRPSL